MKIKYLVGVASMMVALSAPSFAQGMATKPVTTGATTEASTGPALPAPSASARDLFSKYKDRLVQVRVLLNSANEQSSLGSGFVVRDDGDNGAWFVTNYHVVSSLAISPDKFRIELRSTSEQAVKATLVAVDVLHDLAVLKIDGQNKWNAPILGLRDTAVTQGERIFSMGNPLELGFLISEGIYNGLVETRIYDQMLFSGALNSGMSGGPTIDESGEAVGVNVATRRGAELISFLVPIKYARDLLEVAYQAKPRKEWRTEISKQLLAHQQLLTNKLLGVADDKKPTDGFASQNLAGRPVPTINSSLTKCWAGGKTTEKPSYQKDILSCNLHADLFIRGSFYTGTMSLEHEFLRNNTLATAQFLELNSINRLAAFFQRNGNGGETTDDECRDEFVSGKTHTYRVSLCMKAFNKFDDVYDYTVTAVQVDDIKERLTSTLTLKGFSFDNGQKISGIFLEKLQ